MAHFESMLTFVHVQNSRNVSFQQQTQLRQAGHLSKKTWGGGRGQYNTIQYNTISPISPISPPPPPHPPPPHPMPPPAWDGWGKMGWGGGRYWGYCIVLYCMVLYCPLPPPSASLRGVSACRRRFCLSSDNTRSWNYEHAKVPQSVKMSKNSHK